MRPGDDIFNDTLSFITCGSVDDGKSTLLGRMLYETKSLFTDQMTTLAAESIKYGTQGKNIDYALILDGLSAEREQGITIDISYRFFSTAKRKFIAADTPGHEQYTRNMVTSASNADAAIILIDATKGILPQTKRHAFIVDLMKVSHVILAVNKMDCVGYDEQVFIRICDAFHVFAQALHFTSVSAIPLSALQGDNIVGPSAKMPWYKDNPLLHTLESLPVACIATERPFRLPVQWVNRPHSGFRGFAGSIVSGCVCVGDVVTVQPSAQKACISSIILYKDILATAQAGQSITVTLDRDVDISRGDVLTTDKPCETSDQFKASLVWVDGANGYAGRRYIMKMANGTTNAVISKINFTYNVETLEHIAASHLSTNDIAIVEICTDREIVFDAFEDVPQMGSFILIDRVSNATVAVGMIKFSLHRAKNVHAQPMIIKRADREMLNGHKSRCIWLTGLSGAGKSTLASALEQKLYEKGIGTYVLDGDNIRQGLNRDLGFTEEARIENIRRVAEVAKLLVDAGLVVIVSFISPFRSDREMARNLFDKDSFSEVFVDAPLDVVEKRDTKGLYKKARAGQIPHFTGISSPYEVPENPELIIRTHEKSVEESITSLLSLLNI